MTVHTAHGEYRPDDHQAPPEQVCLLIETAVDRYIWQRGGVPMEPARYAWADSTFYVYKDWDDSSVAP